MKFELIFIGKTQEKYLEQGIVFYLDKLNHYIGTEVKITAPAKTKNQATISESDSILKNISPKDFIVLLDEKGSQLSSEALSMQIQKWMNFSYKKVVFIVGGAFGVDERIKTRANFTWSISKLTFTHQMVRLILLEQLYRAMTILNGESYHHD
jgi:23S rRNA (pseudouridine1915-N3)-methyltransferase